MPHITVLGAGSWGTAISKHLVDNDQKVTIWDRKQKTPTRNKRRTQFPIFAYPKTSIK